MESLLAEKATTCCNLDENKVTIDKLSKVAASHKELDKLSANKCKAGIAERPESTKNGN